MSNFLMFPPGVRPSLLLVPFVEVVVLSEVVVLVEVELDVTFGCGCP